MGHDMATCCYSPKSSVYPARAATKPVSAPQPEVSTPISITASSAATKNYQAMVVQEGPRLFTATKINDEELALPKQMQAPVCTLTLC